MSFGTYGAPPSGWTQVEEETKPSIASSPEAIEKLKRIIADVESMRSESDRLAEKAQKNLEELEELTSKFDDADGNLEEAVGYLQAALDELSNS